MDPPWKGCRKDGTNVLAVNPCAIYIHDNSQVRLMFDNECSFSGACFECPDGCVDQTISPATLVTCNSLIDKLSATSDAAVILPLVVWHILFVNFYFTEQGNNRKLQLENR